MAEPTFLGDGNTPRRTDTLWTIAQKTLGAIRENTSGGGGGGGSYAPGTAEQLHGNGSPEGVVTAQIGQHYKDDLTQEIYWKATGAGTNTGWI